MINFTKSLTRTKKVKFDLIFKTLSNVLRSPMSFFDTTPQGRILNRLGKDVDVLDTYMSDVFKIWIFHVLTVASSFVIIAYTIPLFLIPIPAILALYYLIQR